MQLTVLNKIVESKTAFLKEQKLRLPLTEFKDGLRPSRRDFYAALNAQSPCFILECKKASPSKGLIRENFSLKAIAKVYGHYAQAISVLTDEAFFQGSYDYLRTVSALVTQPVVCKDFIIEPYQVYIARHYGADAILLMLSVLDDDMYIHLAALAHELNMGVLTEASNEAELQRAIDLKAKVIGINNRDLRDLSVDINKTRCFAPKIPKDRIVISESGIKHHGHVADLSPYVNGFLIGSALMAQEDLEHAVRTMIYGNHKVCGLTRVEDALCVYEQGISYGGLIFIEASPRYLSPEKAKRIIENVALKYVGVFQNAPIAYVVNIAQTLNLAAVQLHGDETQAYIVQLREALPETCQIWKALKVHDTVPNQEEFTADRYVIDGAHGGSGVAFDWSLLTGKNLEQTLIAGGIDADNAHHALSYKPLGLDINSGVEHAKGIKDPAKIHQFFTNLRTPLQKI